MKKMILGYVGMMSMVTLATTFSYQGVLRDATGTALADKNKEITFRLYNDPSSETALWESKKAVLLDNDGLFNIELGDSTLDDIIAQNAGGVIYIGLTVTGSSGEIRPRQKILSVPVASFAQDVTQAKNDFTVAGKATFNTDAQVTRNLEVRGTNSVTTLSVNNGATIAGTVNVTGPLNLSSGRLDMPSGATFTIGGTSAVIPKGVIVMWSGSTTDVPAGWALCDGNDGRPNLQDRFIVGAGNDYRPDQTGGAAQVTLTVDQIPSHDHQFVGDDELSSRADWGAYYVKDYGSYDADSSKGNSKLYKTTATGGGQAHENLPPYYALCFIIKL